MKPNRHSSPLSHPTLLLAPPQAETGTVASAASFSPHADDISRRAYMCYENQGCQSGRDVQHWLEAESQLLFEHEASKMDL